MSGKKDAPIFHPFSGSAGLSRVAPLSLSLSRRSQGEGDRAAGAADRRHDPQHQAGAGARRPAGDQVPALLLRHVQGGRPGTQPLQRAAS